MKDHAEQLNQTIKDKINENQDQHAQIVRLSKFPRVFFSKDTGFNLLAIISIVINLKPNIK